MSASETTPALERWKALALLLPPALLAWPGPGSLSHDDVLPHATGAGVIALAALPAALLFALRPGATRPRAFLLLPLLGVAAACTVGSATDSFEVRRAALHFAATLVLFFGGAGLAPAGLRVFSRGVVCISLALIVVALFDEQNALAGTLGNSGSTAMAALPGALVGAALIVSGTRAWKLAGGLTFMLYAAYTARVPVVAGGLALGAGVAALALGTWTRSRALAGVLAVLALLCATSPLALRSHAGAPAASPAASPVASPVASDGGVEVRRRVWSASLAMLGDHPWLGVGPGQFAAAFPPYRDPREIEISTHGRQLPVETEVEHPHQDWLLPTLELGAPLGLAWVAFLALVAAGAWRAVRADDLDRSALGAAAIGILAYACFHAPLTQVPASASMAFAAFGAVLARPGRGRVWPLFLLLVCAAPLARAYVRHGLWLASLAQHGEQNSRTVEHTIESALNCCHDSPVATALLARFHEQQGSDAETVARAWSGVLAHRPHNVEALMQLGLASVQQGDFAGARARYERARALDPGHPGIAKNLRLIDLQEGRFESGRTWLEGADPIAEECYARAKTARAGGDRVLGDLFEARAQLLWARGHAADGRFDDAVRSYRQCVRVTRDYIDLGAARVRLELAAALVAAGRSDEARAAVSELDAARIDREGFPGWATSALGTLESAQ